MSEGTTSVSGHNSQGIEGSHSPAEQYLRRTRGDAVRDRSSQPKAVKCVLVLTVLLLLAPGAFGQLTANPSTINFGNVPLGTGATQSVAIANPGGQRLTLSLAGITGTGFSLSGLASPVTLSPGQSLNVTVAFSPQSAGTATGGISLTYNGAFRHHDRRTNNTSVLTVSLSGTGISPGLLVANPSSVSFGSLLVGNSQTQAVSLTNSGGTSVTVSQATTQGSGFSVSGLTLPVTLPAGWSTGFSVTFAPQAAGTANGNIAFATNASNSTLNLGLSGSGMAPSSLSPIPAGLNFGNVQTGNNQTLVETLTNSGGSSVTVTQAAVTGSGFTMNGLNLPLTLAPGQSSPNFNVVFAPQLAGAASGSLSLTSNASNPTLNIPLSGTGVTGGVLAANPSSLNFGNVQTANNQTLAGTVTNSGGSSVTVTQAAVTGSGFTMNGLNLPLILAPGQSSPNFNVVFAPQSAGAASGTLSLTSNASNPTLNI